MQARYKKLVVVVEWAHSLAARDVNEKESFAALKDRIEAAAFGLSPAIGREARAKRYNVHKALTEP